MSNELDELKQQIAIAKVKLSKMFESKGQTDLEILKESNKVDELINAYERMRKRTS